MSDNTLDPQTSNGEVRIGKYDYPVANGAVSELQLARFQGKVTFGDYSFDSDPLISSWILTSFTGGQGNERLKSGVDDDTFWDARLETRFPNGPTLLPITDSYLSEVGTETQAYALGDFPAIDPSFYAVFDSSIQQWSEISKTFTEVAVLTSSPRERGVEFNDLLYIPQGAAGYSTMDAAHVVVNATDMDVIHFLTWDNKLAALTTTGELYILTLGGVWTTDAALKLPSGQIPRKLVEFVNQSSDPTLHIVTMETVYAYDPDVPKLYQTHLKYPKHPDQGLGAANWRGESMYVSVGLGVHGYNGATVISMGPDGRYGMPARLRGRITDLVGEYNSLLAVVEGQGDESAVAAVEGIISKAPLYRDQNTYQISNYRYRPTFSCILRWASTQWHKVWESKDASGRPNWAFVSIGDGAYRLWWGYGAKMYTQEIPVAYQNSKQSLQAGTQRFEKTGDLITGWFNADMVAFRKLASHVEVNLEDVLQSNVSGGTVRIEYQSDNDTQWHQLGTTDFVGRKVMPFNQSPKNDGSLFSYGLDFDRIRFRITMDRPDTLPGDEYLSPLMGSMVFKFIKIPLSQLSWSFNVPLTQDEEFKGVGTDTLYRYLEDLLTSRQMVEFGFQDSIYRVRAAQVQAGSQTGYDRRRNVQVNLVEVRTGVDEPQELIFSGDV